MPQMNGIEASNHIRQNYPSVRVLALSSFQENESVRMMLANGASGYILKHALATDLVPALRAVQSHATILSNELLDALLHPTALQGDTRQEFDLTKRELEVIKLMAEGYNNQHIAQELFISVSTVKFHINNIIEKMGVSTRAEAIVLAAKNDLL